MLSNAFIGIGVNNVSDVPTNQWGMECFAIQVEQGKTYTLVFKNAFGEMAVGEGLKCIFDAQDNQIGDFLTNNSWTADRTGTVYVLGDGYVSGTYSIQFEVAVDYNEVIVQALDSIKNYVDAKDASVKTFAQGLIDNLMNTTDLTEKLALLNEINQILDGDTATAGFQLWESNVAKLNSIESELVTTKNDFSLSISNLSNDVTKLKSATSSNPFASMKSKAATIFAV